MPQATFILREANIKEDTLVYMLFRLQKRNFLYLILGVFILMTSCTITTERYSKRQAAKLTIGKNFDTTTQKLTEDTIFTEADSNIVSLLIYSPIDTSGIQCRMFMKRNDTVFYLGHKEIPLAAGNNLCSSKFPIAPFYKYSGTGYYKFEYYDRDSLIAHRGFILK